MIKVLNTFLSTDKIQGEIVIKKRRHSSCLGWQVLEGTNCKRGTYFLVSWVNVYVSKPSNWCHEILVTAPKLQEGILYKFIFMFMSVLQSSTELACVGCIYSVLCTSHCVVFYNVPSLMGQVLGKVLLTSWEIS